MDRDEPDTDAGHDTERGHVRRPERTFFTSMKSVLATGIVWNFSPGGKIRQAKGPLLIIIRHWRRLLVTLTAKDLTDSMTDGKVCDYVVRAACRDDIPQLKSLIDQFVQANRLLPRTTDELSDLVPFGFVAESDGQIVGFAALEIYSAKLAEIRSLAVHQAHHGKGIGRRLVQSCVDLAVQRNVLEVMAITSTDGFFKACGFDFTLPGEKKALFIQTRDEY